MALPSEVRLAAPMLVKDATTLLQIQDLRRLAWSANGEVPDFIAKQDILLDEHDVHGMHWTIMHQSKPIAAARMCIHNSASSMPDPEALDGYTNKFITPCAALTRLVVHPDFQRRGLSKTLDNVRIDHARLQGCRAIVGVTETAARMGQLERCGFIYLGPTRIRYLSYSQSHVMLKLLDSQGQLIGEVNI